MSEAYLTQIKPMLEAMARADLRLRQLRAEKEKIERAREQIRTQVARLMGNHTVGLVDGVAVLKRTTSKQFATARFREENPDLYDLVKTYEMTETVDQDKLKQMAPQIHEQYLTVRWTNSLEVADE